jgi:hypothetical protein
LYPDFKYFLEGIFKTEMPGFLGTIKTFGFFMAIAFLLAAWLLKTELQRKEKIGLLQPELVPFKKPKNIYRKKKDRSSQPKVFRFIRIKELEKSS